MTQQRRQIGVAIGQHASRREVALVADLWYTAVVLFRAILRLAPHYPGVQRVILFGSLIKAGQFRSDSDVDVAVECDTLEREGAFWHALEQELERDIDVRSLTATVAEIVAREGEMV